MTDEDERLAVDLLYRAITAPLMQIAENAGTEGAVVLERVKVEKRDGPRAITEADLAGRLDNDQDSDETADDNAIESDPNLAENDFGLFEALNILKGLSILEQARR